MPASAKETHKAAPIPTNNKRFFDDKFDKFTIV